MEAPSFNSVMVCFFLDWVDFRVMRLLGRGVVRLLGLRIVRRCYFLRCRSELVKKKVSRRGGGSHGIVKVREGRGGKGDD
jgi:hypothetical protein